MTRFPGDANLLTLLALLAVAIGLPAMGVYRLLVWAIAALVG
jgi:hypothetical protein